MKPYYKSTEFWFVVASLYFWPLAVAGYNLSRGIAKYSARFKDGMVTTEAYLSLVGLLVVYVRHMSPYIGAAILASYCISRGICKLSAVTKTHNVKINI